MKEIIISMDLEYDLIFPDKYLGIELAMPPFLEILDDAGIKADFFALSEIILKFKPLMRRIIEAGHIVGSHGHIHLMMCKESYDTQLQYLEKSKQITEDKLGTHVKMFRAPDFSANGDTIRALEKTGYSIDSSVLPGRAPKKWRLFPIHYDFSSAPVHPYYPSFSDVSKEGESNILEIPVTQNPYAKGGPIGMGYLNFRGVNDTIKSIESAEGSPIIFLVHPWEMINLREHYPSIKKAWEKTCSNNLDVFRSFINKLKEQRYNFIQLSDVFNKLTTTIKSS